MQPDAKVDPKLLRHGLGRFATGVAVVTSRNRTEEPIGLTINSFSSVSLDPALVLWNLSSQSRYLADFLDAGHFAINILAAHQQEVCGRFASGLEDRFAGVGHRHGIEGLPLLDQAIATFQCARYRVIEAGDHHIILGEVIAMSFSDDPPLVLCKGELRAWHPALSSA